MIKTLCLLFSFSTLATSYMHQSQAEIDGAEIFTSQDWCRLKHSTGCLAVPAEYNSETHKVVNGSIVLDANKKASNDSRKAAKIQKINNIKNIVYSDLSTPKKRVILDAMVRYFLRLKEKDDNDF